MTIDWQAFPIYFVQTLLLAKAAQNNESRVTFWSMIGKPMNLNASLSPSSLSLSLSLSLSIFLYIYNIHISMSNFRRFYLTLYPSSFLWLLPKFYSHRNSLAKRIKQTARGNSARFRPPSLDKTAIENSARFTPSPLRRRQVQSSDPLLYIQWFIHQGLCPVPVAHLVFIH